MLDALQVPAIEGILVNLDLGQTIPNFSVNHQFGNVRGGKRIGTKTKNVIKENEPQGMMGLFL